MFLSLVAAQTQTKTSLFFITETFFFEKERIALLVFKKKTVYVPTKATRSQETA